MQDIRAIGLFAFSCLIAALTQTLPVWLSVFALASIVLRFWRNLKIPTVLLYSLIVLGFSYLGWEAPRFWHRNTLAGAFVISTIFYILAPAHKNRVMRFHAGLYALLTSVLVVPRETYPLPIYLLLTLLVSMSLIYHHAPTHSTFSLLSIARTIGRLALPISLLMVPVYHFFPEIDVPRAKSSSTGIANELEPGRIAALALSDRLAFRVKFLTDFPDVRNLYWRTDVFEASKGLRWTPLSDPKVLLVDYKEPKESIRYQLILDSQLNGLIPTLDLTSSLKTQDSFESTYKPKTQLYRSLSSYIEAGAELTDIYPSEKPDYPPVLPESERVKTYVENLKNKSSKDQIQFLLDEFQSFRYTLEPGVLESQDPLGEFLFETKKGYCEHFAGSFASLLRMAGTPARVVVGFAGGMRLGNSTYLQVTNRSAHAWTEVWYDGFWHRIDPAAYARGAGQTFEEQSSLASLITAWIGFTIESISTWIKDWAEDIGLIWVGIGILAVGLLSLQVYRVTHRTNILPKWEKKMRSYLNRLESRGYAPLAGETVARFLERLDPELKPLAKLYNVRKYAEDETQTEALEKCLREAQSKIRKYPRIKAS